MVLYLIHWERDPDFPRKDLTEEQKDTSYFFVSCLCQSVHDAVKCAEYYFGKKLGYRGSLRFTDGVLKCKRQKVDSRNFTVTYLMLPGMKEPFDCVDAKSNYLRLKDLF